MRADLFVWERLLLWGSSLALLGQISAQANHANLARPSEGEPECEIVENVDSPEAAKLSPAPANLSPYWAQEITGLLFTQKDMRGVRPSVRIGIVDDSFSPAGMGSVRKSKVAIAQGGHHSGHGSTVANVIAGQWSLGSSPTAFVTGLTDNLNFSHYLPELESSLPHLVNISMIYRGKATEKLDAVRSMLDRIDAIGVTASGNDPFTRIDENKKDPNLIKVASVAPTGMLSQFSSISETVDILAPSDHFLRVGSSVGLETFGGTSGAAPLVTAALANVMHYLPNLDAKNARTLLKLTATPLAFSPPAPGMLNAYLMFETAKRLKDLCPEKDRYLSNLCLASFLLPETEEKKTAHKKLMDFSVVAKKMIEDAESKLSNRDCDQRKEGLTLLLRAFLLDRNESTRSRLKEIYSTQSRFSVNALFFKNLGASGKDYALTYTPKNVYQNPLYNKWETMNRLATQWVMRKRPEVDGFLNSKYDEGLEAEQAAIVAIAVQHASRLKSIIAKGQVSPSSLVRSELLGEVRPGSNDNSSILLRGIRDVSPLVRKKALDAVHSNLESMSDLEVFAYALRDTDRELVLMAEGLFSGKWQEAEREILHNDRSQSAKAARVVLNQARALVEKLYQENPNKWEVAKKHFDGLSANYFKDPVQKLKTK